MKKYKKIFIYCPAFAVTGGPDALHQLAYYLNKIGCDAEIVYFTFSLKSITIPEPYKGYVSNYCLEQDVIDGLEYAVVVPEFAVEKTRRFKKSKVFIWWLSVDNNLNRSSFFWKCFYFATLPARLIINFGYYKSCFREAVIKTLRKETYSFSAEHDNVEHLCASYYAYNYVCSHTKRKAHLCIEPISKFFLDSYSEWKQVQCSENDRSDEIIFNPKKSGCFVKQIASTNVKLKFIPLEGMTQAQLVEKYKKAKLYVDFGPFPGAERMPKEAVLFGCSVITGLNGASSVYEDVPIPDVYKFETTPEQIPFIVKKIYEVLNGYEHTKMDFDEYRSTVLNLEKNFIEKLREVFLC